MLLPDEYILSSIGKDTIILTNKRFQYKRDQKYTDVFLEKTYAVEAKVIRQAEYLFLGAILFLLGLSLEDKNLYIGLFCLLACLLFYLTLPKCNLLIHTSRGTFTIKLTKVKPKALKGFVFLAEKQLTEYKFSDLRNLK